MFLLLISLSVSDCHRFTSITTELYEMNDTVFEKCDLTSPGGADIIACTFLNCSSDVSGCAIYFLVFQLSIVQSSTFSCAAAEEWASLFADYGTSAATFRFSDGASVGGSAERSTFLFFVRFRVSRAGEHYRQYGYESMVLGLSST
jgi:hypothetical protein